MAEFTNIIRNVSVFHRSSCFVVGSGITSDAEVVLVEGRLLVVPQAG